MSDMICCDCGNIFDEGEAKIIRERHDEIPGGFCEEFYACPSCGSDSVKDAVRCKKCGGSFLYERLWSGYYCSDCLSEFIGRTSYITAFAIANAEEFAEYVFEREEAKAKKNPQTEPVTRNAENGQSRLE